MAAKSYDPRGYDYVIVGAGSAGGTLARRLTEDAGTRVLVIEAGGWGPAPRGKVIGGSSSINAMAYVRGNPGDYDRWARTGLTGWSYAEVLPYFRRQESWEGGASDYRGGDGPLTVQTTTYQDTLVEAFLAPRAALQMPRTPDYKRAQP